MDRYERLLKLHRLLQSARYPVRLQHLQDELECSRATIYRDIAFLRDALGAPIEGGSEAEASFCYPSEAAETFELPGLWLSSGELEALLAMHQLLASTGGTVLSGTLAPLRHRIEKLLAEQSGGKRWPIERIRVTRSLSRQLDETAFRMVAGAVLERRRLKFRYRARSTNQDSERLVSPQRLTHYRENWYLDAYDHEREGLRSFSLDRILKPVLHGSEAALDVADADLDSHLAGGYGIFSGAPKAWATIRFSPRAARWVADEHWHSKQEGHLLDDGHYELRLPYASARELLMDVLRYGPDAEIIAPVALREEARIQLRLALNGYEPSTP
ncbi:MAG: transcriptional regulator [Lysobacterales bacterium CG02_land_8_20_14_3_00_62_12]|nr:MAG: transcriptional regulator [Xanthomonadales bacterium CG02_land_8_20_14_3_00_62_12]